LEILFKSAACIIAESMAIGALDGAADRLGWW